MSEQSTSTNNAGPVKAPPQILSNQQKEALLRSAAFGDIVGILMRAPKHKNLRLETLGVFVLPALVHNQYLIARIRQEANGGPAAAGLALWACVSDEIDQKLRAGPEKPMRLKYNEWKSGPNLWLVDLVAPSPLAGSILKDLHERVAKGKPMSAQILSDGGAARITTIQDMLADMKKAKN